MLKIYNTLNRRLEEFKSIEPGKIRFYHCGPTVYWTQHIGNMRAMTMADFIRRGLLYLDYEVKFVRNYTDVGHLTGDNIGDADSGIDRMEKAHRREGITPDEIANKYIEIFEHDVTSLNNLPVDYKPRATEYVQQMIEMVEKLVDKGFAYITPQAVYFDVTKATDYTKLSGQKLELNEIGAGKGDVLDGNKKHPADFSVWFFKTGAHKNALQTWPSPFVSPEVENGEGFPGWHIECSAMSKAELGETIDIHMGGVEHIPVHHPNEIAQSEAANGVKFVNYWIHNEHLDVDHKKMSKSGGTSYSLEDILERGYSPLDLRYFFMQAHYRSKQNFTWEALSASQTAFARLRNKVNELFVKADTNPLAPGPSIEFKTQFLKAIEDDFNIPSALATAWNVLKSDLLPDVQLATILDFDKVLGLKLESSAENPNQQAEIAPEVQALIDRRQKARNEGDYVTADRIRDELMDEYGIKLADK